MKLLRTISWSASTSRFSMGLMLGAAAISNGGISIASAETIKYDNSSPGSTLQPEPSWMGGATSNSFYPTAIVNNNVTVDYTTNTPPTNVYGGLADSKEIKGNHVYINKGTIGSNVFGGYGAAITDTSTVDNNHVHIGENHGSIGDIVGGRSNIENLSAYGATVSHNTVEVKGNNNIIDNIYGGYAKANLGSGKVTVDHNEVSIIGKQKLKTDKSSTYGGYAERGAYNSSVISVEGNTVKFNGLNSTSSTNNTITGGYINGNYAATAGGSSTAKENHVTITADKNSTFGTINGAVINNDRDATLTGNTVNIDGGKYAFVYGTQANTNAHLTPTASDKIVQTGNSVSFKNATIKGGGDILGTSSNASTVTTSGTTVTLENSTANDVYGDFAFKLGTGTLSLNNSTINIKDSVVGDVFGSAGFAGSDSKITEKGNIITISGQSTIYNDIFGGMASGHNSADMSTTNNIVTLDGTDITIGGSIYGGYASNSTDFDKVKKGNTLNLNGYRGRIGGSIYNIENYNWTLPSDVHNGDTLITIEGNAVDLTDTKHTIVGIAGSPANNNRLYPNDVITLISKSTGKGWTGTGADNIHYIIPQGQFIYYTGTLTQDGSKPDTPFILTIDAANAGGSNGGSGNGGSAANLNPQSKAYSEGRIAALGLVNQGNELISTAGIDHIRTMVRANDEKANHPALIPFAITNGSSLRYKTGSHVDINSFNLAAGLATGLNFASGGKAIVGAFFEYGHGDYDTYNRFANFASVRGDGNSHYQGGGIFGRIDIANSGMGRVTQLPPDQADGAYVEASVRTGRVNSEFDVGRNADALGNFTGDYRGSYRSKVDYYGGHLAGGYVFNFDDKQSLDTYARYLWTKMNGDTVKIGNESLHFDSTDSSRLQIGGRYGYALNERFKPYAGAIYEYEFDGKAKAKAYEFNLDRPTLKGSTGIFEAGFHFQPLANDASFSIDVTGQGYVGKRKGGGGNVKVKYQF